MVPAGSRFGPCAKNTVARGSVDRGGGFVNELVSLVVWFCKGRERERAKLFGTFILRTEPVATRLRVGCFERGFGQKYR